VAGEIIAIIICGLRGILPETWHRSLPSIFTGNVPTSDSEPSFSITALFLFGTALVMCGTHLRLAAKRALGQHFTYEVLVHRKHTLVTSYPYTLVRHPGYVGGGIAAVGGDVALILAPGSWIREVLWPLWVRQSGMIGHILAAVFILGPPVIHALMLGGLVARVPGEDRLMRETFGPEWTAWAKRVPYKLIPGVY
jgi:protein-S-isoprenylcysteine O-methyltransferase Ste14